MRVANERGVALLVVLTVVALLTIVVTEFTYSVQLDQHRARNALNALQATLMARSGVNVAEGFLVQDEEPTFDAYSEDWWRALDEFCAGWSPAPSMRVACRVWDESGKININNTRPARGTGRTPPAAKGAGPVPVTEDMVLRDALRALFQKFEIEVDTVDRLKEYWLQEPTPDPRGTAAVTADLNFGSLEDFAAKFGIPTPKLQRLRPYLTARSRGQLPKINVNTAPFLVLAAVLGDAGAASRIVERQRGDEPFRNAGEVNQVLAEGSVVDASVRARVFTTRSRLFRLEASAVTNVDPQGVNPGGIAQTLGVLVVRNQNPALKRAGAPGLGWTLKAIDWQKEGGARLFERPETDTEEGFDDIPSSGEIN